MEIQIHLSRPDITDADIQAVVEVLRSPNLSLGPKVGEFEKAFADRLGRKHAIAVNSGTSGLFLCVSALGIGPGDEVITTPFTFIASSNPILMAGAKPVFVDIGSNTLNIDPGLIESKINSKTRAVLPVEIFGSPAGFDRISQIAARHDLPVIEDSCEALGSSLNGKPAGTFGAVSVFGFYPNKQITTGEGGMILTDDETLAQRCISLRNQGRSRMGGWLAHERLGYNFRLSDINCALGIAQLSRIDQIKTKRRQVAAWYREMLVDEDRLIVPTEPKGCEINWFVYVVRLTQDFTAAQRNDILDRMMARGIQVSNYFPPVHLQPFMVERFGFAKGDFPVTESVSERTIALPFYNNLAKDDVAVVCRTLKEVLDSL